MRSCEGRAWTQTLEHALVPLVDSATGHRFRLPPLTNAKYCDVGAAANKDPGPREVFDQYVINLNDDPSEVIEVQSRHLAIEPNAVGNQRDGEHLRATIHGGQRRIRRRYTVSVLRTSRG